MKTTKRTPRDERQRLLNLAERSLEAYMIALQDKTTTNKPPAPERALKVMRLSA